MFKIGDVVTVNVYTQFKGRIVRVEWFNAMPEFIVEFSHNVQVMAYSNELAFA